MSARLISMRYDILERTGEGSLFHVFKTRDKVLGRVVAVKTLLPAYASDSGIGAALRKAAAGLLDLSHPNIARVYDLGEEEGVPFLVTEFVRGINLKERIRRIAPFTHSVAVDFGIAIGEALQHAQAQGIIHGDLRPQNVIVTPEGALKVTDFGLTSIYASNADAVSGVREQAVHYEAPELAATGLRSVATDIYALGALLYEMLCGSTPYPAETVEAVVRKHQEDPVPSPKVVNPGVPKALEGIVMKALRKRPEERYHEIADMLNDLKQVRDALRFGKPLSWSPDDDAAPSAAVTPSVSPEAAAAAAAVATTKLNREAPKPGARRMPSTTAAADDRISPYLKLALATVIVILITAVVAGVAVWMATFAKPPDKEFPNIMGMRIEQAQEVARKYEFRLIPHEKYHAKTEAGVIYQTDWPAGRPIRPGRTVNVWISKGSPLVWVPKLTSLNAEEAEAKLKEAGLTLGEVDRQYSESVGLGEIISQNPRASKRVSRDIPVNLVISDGPKPTPIDPQDENPAITTPDPGYQEPPAPSPGQDEDAANLEPRMFNLNVDIKRDGRGRRRVRVEYEDARGAQTAVDEDHDEGDVISQRVEVYGSRLTVRVYYDDNPVPASEKTQRLPRRQ